MKPIIFTKKQIDELNSFVQKKMTDVNSNINYKLDYIKLFIHPETESDIYVKIRIHGFSGGAPFDDINYHVIQKEEAVQPLEMIVRDLNAKYKFIADLREIKLDNGKPIFI